MYMNGRGPMMGGPRGRGPMGGMHRPMGFRPMGMHRRNVPFPMAGLGMLLFPALLFGGWMIVAAVGAVFGLALTVLGWVFSGIASLASGIFSGITSVGSVAIGIVIDLALFSKIRAKKAQQDRQEWKVEGEDGETESGTFTVEEEYQTMNTNQRTF